MQKENRKKNGLAGEEEIKLSLFINEKIGEQKPVAFLYINNEVF